MEEKKSLNESIIAIRVKLQDSKIKKSGKNKFAGFEFFELADFLPTLNKLMEEEGVNDLFSIRESISGVVTASLTLIKGDEMQEYNIPFKLFDTPVNKDGKPSMQDIQYLGALNTYYKRYLYLNAFGITDGEVIDNMDNEDVPETDYRQMLIDYCNKTGLDMNELAKEYKLNAKSKNEKFKEVLEKVAV